jgi:glutamate-1-semialdehyde 2,1-aminomutase
MQPKRYSESENFLKQAEAVIPLGAQTFSKSKTQFPFGVSPYFATHAEGAYLYDVDDNKYLDFINSLAAITLGYQDPDVLKSVKTQLEKGTIFSLSSTLEYEVAEKICDMVPCAEMVRFGKNGTDATSAAIRLARAFTGKDHVAVCGYHGWQDWYIGSTTRDLGVPKAVKNLTHTFEYNSLDSLETLLNQYDHQMAAVIMEPVNVNLPAPGFLEGVQTLAKKHGAVFIFDETITGFRFANGGAQEYFGVTPDLACFGKGIANGYPLSAIVGRKDIMMRMEDIFFSGTFGGETLSLAAADAVLKKLESNPVIESIWNVGEYLEQTLLKKIHEYELGAIFSLKGYPVWSFFTFEENPYFEPWELKTLYMQEMFKNGILCLGAHNISYSHNKDHIDRLLDAYEHYFKIVKDSKGADIKKMLNCEVLKPLFKVR